MLMDKENLLSDAQSLAQVVGTYASTNTIDLGAPGTIPWLGGTQRNDVGRGTHRLQVLCQVITAFTGATATVQFQLITSASANLGTPTVMDTTEAIAVATLIAGYQVRLSCIPHGVAQRYLGLQYLIATATTTAGTVTAGLVLDRQTNLAVV